MSHKSYALVSAAPAPEPYAKKPAIKSCPHALATYGVVTMPSEAIAQLAGAVVDKDEWLCFLLGKRSEQGLLVEIEEIVVPFAQDRSMASCSFDNCPIPSGTVGVLHSHNSMSAFFSGTDYATFNGKFGLSIVIAQPNKGGDEATMLGFDYKAEGKFRLPCGSLGVCEFYLQPSDLDDWPFPVNFNRGIKSDYTYMGDCDRLQINEAKSSNYYYVYSSECGLEDKKSRAARRVFGSGDEILKALPPPRKILVGSKTGPLERPWEKRKDKGKALGRELSTMTDEEWDEYLAYYEMERGLLERY